MGVGGALIISVGPDPVCDRPGGLKIERAPDGEGHVLPWQLCVENKPIDRTNYFGRHQAAGRRNQDNSPCKRKLKLEQPTRAKIKAVWAAGGILQLGMLSTVPGTLAVPLCHVLSAFGNLRRVRRAVPCRQIDTLNAQSPASGPPCRQTERPKHSLSC